MASYGMEYRTFWPTVERKMTAVVEQANERGHGIPTSVKQIDPFPVGSYLELRQGILRGKLNILRFSFRYNMTLFHGMAYPVDKAIMYAGQSLMFVVPVVAVTLAWFLSKWFLMLALSAFLSPRVVRARYNHVIRRAAFRSEIVFCYLYFIRQVSVLDVRTDKNWFRPD